jgi:hypothetical protein
MSKGLAVVLTENSYECLELHYPRLRLIEAGYTVQVIFLEFSHYKIFQFYVRKRIRK